MWCQMKNYYEQYDTIQGIYTHKIELDFIQQAIKDIPKKSRILDISAGGRISIPLAVLGFRVVASEIDLKPLEFIKKNAKDKY